MSEVLWPADVVSAQVARELAELRAENARLLRLLKLTRAEAAPPGPGQAGFFEAPPGPVYAGSPASEKVAFFRALFASRAEYLRGPLGECSHWPGRVASGGARRVA